MNQQRDLARTQIAPSAPAYDDDVAPGRGSRSSRMDAPAHPIIGGLIQRKARDANGVAEGADAAVAAAASSSGSPLPETIMRQFEASLGADLSSVRVHTGNQSAEAASAVGAKAYTVGQDIHFAAGQYDPSSSAGQHLLAHEVAHTVQQAGGTPTRQHKLEVSSPGDATETEADRAADAMVASRSVILASAPAAAERVAREKSFQEQRQERHDDLTAGPTKAQAAALRTAQGRASLILGSRRPISWKSLQGPGNDIVTNLVKVMGDSTSSSAVRVSLENVLAAAANLKAAIDGRALPRAQMLSSLQGTLLRASSALDDVLKPHTLWGITVTDREMFEEKLAAARQDPNHTIPGTAVTITDEPKIIRDYQPPSKLDRAALQEIRSLVQKTASRLDLKYANPDLKLIRDEADNELTALRGAMGSMVVGASYRANIVLAESSLSQALAMIAGAIGTEDNDIAMVHLQAGDVLSGIGAILAMPPRRDPNDPNDHTPDQPRAGDPPVNSRDDKFYPKRAPDPWGPPSDPPTPLTPM